METTTERKAKFTRDFEQGRVGNVGENEDGTFWAEIRLGKGKHVDWSNPRYKTAGAAKTATTRLAWSLLEAQATGDWKEMLLTGTKPRPHSRTWTRRVPDHVTDALMEVFKPGGTFTFNEAFDAVWAILKAKNGVSGGEEMIRLRCYEKLQNLCFRSIILKDGKQYTINPEQPEQH